MPQHFNRRRFLRSTAAAGALGFWLGSARADDKKAGPNERLAIGVIGTAYRAAANWHARLNAETAVKLKRVTQMGTQIHAEKNYRRVVELIETGAIGKVREVHVWCAKSWGGVERPKGSQPVPAGLNWDLWLGPAPERPYY